MAEREDAPFETECDADRLGPRWAGRFEALPVDPWVQRFASGDGPAPHGPGRGALFRALRRVMSDFDADGLLGTHPMALLGPSSWRALVREGVRPRRLLDIGAGSGEVTRHARALFDQIVCTETSRAMRARLRRRGFDARADDVSSPHFVASRFDPDGFDVVALLNVLDRADRPRSLLHAARALTKPDGVLVISVPLPVRPHVDRGGVTVDPDEPVGGHGATFEAALVDLVESTVAPAGLEVVRLARGPYVARGDRAAPLRVLDAALVVARPS